VRSGPQISPGAAPCTVYGTFRTCPGIAQHAQVRKHGTAIAPHRLRSRHPASDRHAPPLMAHHGPPTMDDRRTFGAQLATDPRGAAEERRPVGAMRVVSIKRFRKRPANILKIPRYRSLLPNVQSARRRCGGLPPAAAGRLMTADVQRVVTCDRVDPRPATPRKIDKTRHRRRLHRTSRIAGSRTAVRRAACDIDALPQARCSFRAGERLARQSPAESQRQQSLEGRESPTSCCACRRPC
jgi:hypothetical protein